MRLKKMESNPSSSALSASISASLARSVPTTATSSMLVGGNGGGTTRSISNSAFPMSVPRSPFGLPMASVLPNPKKSLWMNDNYDLSPQAAPDIKCDGFLSKYSSGSITGRWQKRLFVLHNGRLGYFKKAPVDVHSAKPDKSFSLRRIKSVSTRDENPAPGEREFSIQIGEESYRLKAATPSDMRRWLSALNTALAHKESYPVFDDEHGENASSSAADMVSVSNSVTSQSSDVHPGNEDVQAYLQQQRMLAATAANQHETVWEVDLDPDELDKLFSEWFNQGGSDDMLETKTLVGGITLAISHMYSLLGSEVFDLQMTDLDGQFTRARTAMQCLRRSAKSKETTMHSRKDEDPIRTQLNGVLMEYVPRIVTDVTKYLDKRKEVRDDSLSGSVEMAPESTVDDSPTLLPIIDILSLITRDISALYAREPECACTYCEPDSVPSNKRKVEESCVATDRWKKSLRNLLQRLGSEFEVALIESIQSKMLPVGATWDARPGSTPEAPCKTTHVLFGSRANVWLSAWSVSLITACEETIALVIPDPNATVKHSSRLVSELISSVLVAVLNSAWRQFKRKSMRIATVSEVRKRALKEVAELNAANVGLWSVFNNAQVREQIKDLERLPPEEENSLEMPNLLSFGNEALLLSKFVSESIPEQLPFIPKIFESCFEGLGVTFTNTAMEVGTPIVHFHFVEKSYTEVNAAFSLKALTTDIKKTPMIVCRDLTERFVGDLTPYGTHPMLKAQIVNLMPSAVSHIYINALLKNKLKLKSYKSLTAKIESDLIIFKSLFSESRFNCKESVVSKAVEPLSAVHAFLSEQKKEVLIDEIAKKLISNFGPQWSHVITSILLEMRGNDLKKTEKAALMTVVDPLKLAQQPPGSPKHNDGETVWRF